MMMGRWSTLIPYPKESSVDAIALIVKPLYTPKTVVKSENTTSPMRMAMNVTGRMNLQYIFSPKKFYKRQDPLCFLVTVDSDFPLAW